MRKLMLCVLAASLVSWSPPVIAQHSDFDLKEWDVEWGGRTRDPYVAPDGRVWFVGQQGNYIGSVPFDMFGVEFTHRAALCTFEMLCETFGLTEPALQNVAAIVHDLDLKDNRFGATEAPAIGLVIDGLRLAQSDDQQLLAEGITVFDALYRAFTQATLSSGPRPVAKRTDRKPTGGRPRR